MSTTTRQIPPPSGDREPLKTNIFAFVQNSQSALAPLFPYVDEGAIVPCAATFRGAPGRRFGRFQHFNTVDEVLLVFGAEGALRQASGLVRVGPKLHMVTAPFEDPEREESVRVVAITQRQLIGKPHREEYRFVCDKCDRRLFVYEVDATPPQRGKQRETLGDYAPFITIAETYEAARRFNADPEARHCKHCGHDNPPFPIESWAWNTHIDQSAIAKIGHDSLTAATAAAARGREA
ncbi:MAG: hypothetical protein JWL84_4886 [Rhodospirillales bacterium]|jgi:hypothetical protein|nr:hypothetical protein [Rhodospirillales bacterium]